MKLPLSVFALILCIGSGSVAADPYELSTSGSDFGRQSVSDLENGLSLAVDVSELKVLSSHAVARFQSNAARQRTSSGYWVPWNGETESLVDLGLMSSAESVLTFQLTDEDLSTQFLPITFTVIVRTAEDLRWGYLVVDR